MSEKIYVDLSDINSLQHDIMAFVQVWVKEKKTPIPHRETLHAMEERGVKVPTTIKALGVLLRKGYLRRAVTTGNKSFYVQIRSI